MEIQINKHYLIRQKWQYGSDRHDDIMVLLCLRKASENENLDYGGNENKDGYFGKDVKDGDYKYFEHREVISPIKIE